MKIEKMMSSGKKTLPSCVRWTDPFLIAFVVIAAYAMTYKTSLSNTELMLLLCVVVAVVMICVELFYAPWRNQPRPIVPFKTTFNRAFVKWLGVLAGVGLVIFVWWLLPEYRLPRHKALRSVGSYVVPCIPFVTAAWILFTEWRLGSEEDYSWHWGLMVLGRFKEVDWSIARLGLMGWVVKGFFLPLNLSGALSYIHSFRGIEDTLLTMPWPKVVVTIDYMLFALLLIAIIPGYVFSARLLGTGLKKVEESWFGWVVTLVCYPPVNKGTGAWFSYKSSLPQMTGDPWAFHTSGFESLAIIVGCAIILFEFVHYWGESICCLRSSHLTNRGIITNGPFSFTKHPVYVSKFLMWATFFMPFMGGPTFAEEVRRTLIYFLFALIYVMRGWVEERLLSEDPAYVAYGLFMDKQSIFRFMGNWIPLLKYEYRLQRWIKNGIIDPSVLSASKLSP